MANKTKTVVKKKKVVKQERNKNNTNSKDNKSRKVEQAKKDREKQYSRLEKEKQRGNVVKAGIGIDRLTEAIVLAEIIGSPRCKARHERIALNKCSKSNIFKKGRSF